MPDGTVVKEGLLGVCKKGGRVESRYFILHQDRIEYFLSQEDARSGADPRGRLGLKSIQECDELEDSSGFKLVLGEGKGLEVKVYNGQQELDLWLDALASVWADDEQEENKQALAQSEATHAIEKKEVTQVTHQEPARLDSPRTQSQVPPPSRESDKGDSRSKTFPRLRSVSWKIPREEEVGAVVYEGGVGVLKKGVAEARYLILFTDRFELFATIEDYKKSENPRSRVTYEGVENLEFSTEGFSIHHPKRVFQIQVEPESDTVQKWFTALGKVFDFEVVEAAIPTQISADTSMVEKESSSKAPMEDVRPGDVTTKKANTKSDSGTSTAASTASSPHSSAVMSGPPSTTEKPRQPEEPILCQGILSMLRKGQPERRHCLLYQDRLEIYSSVADFQEGKNPRGRIAIKDIQEIDVLDMGFSFKLPDRSLNLHAINKTDFGKWQAALGKLCNHHGEEEQDNAEVGEQSPSIHEGEVTIQYHGASTSSRYMVLVSDGIHIYLDKKARQKNAAPQAIIAKESVKNLDVLDAGFEIQAADNSCIVQPPPSELDGWLQSLGVFFEGDAKEEPLQSRSQLQQVPDSSRHGEHPRLVWQSMLEVQEGGYGVWKYFALYEDVLVSYDAANDMASGKDPEGRIPLNQVQDVKVGSMGFVLQFPAFNLAFRVSNEPGALDAWVAALHRVLVFSSPAREAANPQQLLHQGTLELLEDKQAKLRHFYLYADRLEYFGNTMDAFNGRRCENKILLADVVGFTVGDRGFVIRLAKREFELRVVSREDLEVWVAALRGVLDDQSRRQALSSHQESPAESLGTPRFPGTPGFGGADVNNSWKDWSSSSTPRQGYKMAKVLKLRFPAAKWPLSDKFEAELRSNLHTMKSPRGLQHTLSGVSFKDGCVTAEILGSDGVLEDLRRTMSSPNAQFSVCGYKVGEAIIGTTKVLANPGKDQKEQAIYQGPLGIQHGGCLSQKYFMLFEDRLDYFDSKDDALSGVRPRGRIALGEVSSYEAYGSGFILKLLGRSVGLHVSVDAKDQWSQCLLQALRNSQVAETSKPGKSTARPQGSTGVGRAGGPKARPRPRSTTPRRRPQPNNDSTVNSSQSLNGSIMRSKGSPTWSNTSKADSGHGGWTSTRGDEAKDDRKSDGSYWLSRDTSGKVAERDARVMWTRRGSDPTLTDKVTGDRCASGALASRLAAPRLNDTAQKVNQSLTPRSCPTLGHSRSSPEITGKVNEAGRIPKSTETSLNHRCVNKITDTARDGSGWLRRGPEKTQMGDKVAGLDGATLGRSAQRAFPFASN